MEDLQQMAVDRKDGLSRWRRRRWGAVILHQGRRVCSWVIFTLAMMRSLTSDWGITIQTSHLLSISPVSTLVMESVALQNKDQAWSTLVLVYKSSDKTNDRPLLPTTTALSVARTSILSHPWMVFHMTERYKAEKRTIEEVLEHLMIE